MGIAYKPAASSMDTADLHRVVMAGTRRGRLAVLGFADTVSSRDASWPAAKHPTQLWYKRYMYKKPPAGNDPYDQFHF
jgi:hypothetical protein